MTVSNLNKNFQSFLTLWVQQSFEQTYLAHLKVPWKKEMDLFEASSEKILPQLVVQVEGCLVTQMT